MVGNDLGEFTFTLSPADIARLPVIVAEAQMDDFLQKPTSRNRSAYLEIAEINLKYWNDWFDRALFFLN